MKKNEEKIKFISVSDSGSDSDDRSLNINFGKGIPKLPVTPASGVPGGSPTCIDGWMGWMGWWTGRSIFFLPIS